MMTPSEVVLSRLRSALDHAYGSRIERVVLFGSRARGDAVADSDFDVAVFIVGLTSRWREFRRLADIELKLLDETGAIVHAMPYPAGSWRDASSPLMHEIGREGREL